jgi:hypothetical protein
MHAINSLVARVDSPAAQQSPRRLDAGVNLRVSEALRDALAAWVVRDPLDVAADRRLPDECRAGRPRRTSPPRC